MSDDVLTSTSSAIVPTDASLPSTVDQRLEEMGKTLLDFKLTADKRIEALEQNLRQSQRQIGFLRAGWLLTVLGVGGGFLVFGFLLRLEQVRLQEQVSAIAVHTGPDSEVVQRLDALEPQVPEDLPERLDVAEEALAQMDEDVAVLVQDQRQRREVVSILTEALQAIVADESPTESSSADADAEADADADTDTDDEASEP
ncbi:MAG: hypothetical protein AAGE59_32470 [Cyanobacteria bacterium P01_F01_bin.86]